MILYEVGEWGLGFIWRLDGSVLPRACVVAGPSLALGLGLRYMMDNYPGPYFNESWNQSAVWNVMTIVLGCLLGLRINRAYGRFWEGITLVQMMRAEWLETCSNLMAFTRIVQLRHPDDAEWSDKVLDFQYTLIRLMSLMHGAALRQIGGNQEEFDVLDVNGLDDDSLNFLKHCERKEINRVEVLLHWIQQLITENLHNGVLSVPPPILTRVYQTLSRGMVNLHNARKLADIPFPFALSQTTVVLLLVHGVFTPIFLSVLIDSYVGTAVLTFVPLTGMWSLVYIAVQLEQPFGQDVNDLNLSQLQFELNHALLMLVDPHAQRAPKLRVKEGRTPGSLHYKYGDEMSKTNFLDHRPDLRGNPMQRLLTRFASRTSFVTYAFHGRRGPKPATNRFSQRSFSSVTEPGDSKDSEHSGSGECGLSEIVSDVDSDPGFQRILVPTFEPGNRGNSSRKAKDENSTEVPVEQRVNGVSFRRSKTAKPLVTWGQTGVGLESSTEGLRSHHWVAAGSAPDASLPAADQPQPGTCQQVTEGSGASAVAETEPLTTSACTGKLADDIPLEDHGQVMPDRVQRAEFIEDKVYESDAATGVTFTNGTWRGGSGSPESGADLVTGGTSTVPQTCQVARSGNGANPPSGAEETKSEWEAMVQSCHVRRGGILPIGDAVHVSEVTRQGSGQQPIPFAEGKTGDTVCV